MAITQVLRNFKLRGSSGFLYFLLIKINNKSLTFAANIINTWAHSAPIAYCATLVFFNISFNFEMVEVILTMSHSGSESKEVMAHLCRGYNITRVFVLLCGLDICLLGNNIILLIFKNKSDYIIVTKSVGCLVFFNIFNFEMVEVNLQCGMEHLNKTMSRL